MQSVHILRSQEPQSYYVSELDVMNTRHIHESGGRRVFDFVMPKVSRELIICTFKATLWQMTKSSIPMAAGTLTLIASLYGPRIEILGLEAEPGAASLQFRRICQVSEEVLCNSITMASLDAMAVLEQRTAESIHLLTYDNTRDHGLEQNSGSRSSRQSLQVGKHQLTSPQI